MDEFSLIDQYWNQEQTFRQDVLLGIGDDCALLKVPEQQVLAVSMDTLLADVHFPADALAQNIGYKSLAVNLSDLAAMGAKPAWGMLSITLPAIDEQWINAFYEGFSRLAKAYSMQLVGGDTTQGTLAVTIQVMGFVPKQGALRRNNAQIGDKIIVTGKLGAAALGLQVYYKKLLLSKTAEQEALNALHYPTPAISQGRYLIEIGAHAAIDISDGLLADLGHILKKSAVSAIIDTDAIPLAACLQEISLEQALQYACSGGDDYQLCFTLSADKVDLLKNMEGAYSVIGEVIPLQSPLIEVVGKHKEILSAGSSGYIHFTGKSFV